MIKLNTFDVIELKDETKAIVLGDTNNSCRIKKVDNLGEIVSVNKNDIKEVIYKKENKYGS